MQNRSAAGSGSKPAVAGRTLVRATVQALEGYVPGEQPTDPEVIKLNTNENPYPPSSRVKQAISDAAEHLWLYPDPTAARLREQVGRLLEIDPDGVVVGNGSDEILSLLMRAVVDPGGRVAYPVPTYSLYDPLVAMQGGVSVQIPFPGDFSLPSELADVRACMRIVCNPNAPTGTMVPVEALAELAVACPSEVLVVDEAYVDFADASAVGLVGRQENVVVLRTLSKSYSLAGLRVGFALAHPRLAAQIHKVRDSYNVSRLAQAGAVAALEDQATMRAQVERIRDTRGRLDRGLRALGFEVVSSQANFVLARTPGVSLRGVVDELRRRGILVRHFEALADSMRITVGTDEQIEALLAALALIRG